ncbi:ATP-binding protein [Hydrogenibacillus schlegelii]|uniref:histidine kinase n=1 Tax=Hydrogenibacillus schlegelii TaxID=1484 RepID=A0A132MFY4_HYDSH|nr:ATP-binding protein [Hydrogenibacillus schlegelii]KWW96689.1 hypothetical protein TR75_12590 [Hydrogenibacillus schlegelii]OAR05308.1 hypothetical protein SA87_08035 [Hydrogenibacillus schlegelii]
MITRSVVGKLWLTIVAVGTIALVTLGMLLAQLFQNYFYTRETRDLGGIADAVVRVLAASSSRGDALAVATALVANENRTLVFIRPEEVGRAREPVRSMLEDPRFQPAWRGERVAFQGRYPVARDGGTVEEAFIVVAAGFPAERGTNVVLLYESTAPVREAIGSIDRLIFFAIVFALLTTTVFALFLTRRITLPLRDMIRAANHIAEGNYSLRLDYDFQDEVGSLARSFNHMARKLEETLTTLKRQTDERERILVSLGEGVLSVDRALQIRLANPHARRLLERAFGERDRLPEPLAALFRRTIEQRKGEEALLEAGGVHLIAVTAPLLDDDETLGAVGVLRDTTRQRQLDQLRQDFIANVSHELKTPLAMLQGYTEAILDGLFTSPEELRELVNIIYEEILRMGRLVNDLLDYTRIETGNFALDIEEIALEPLFDRLQRRYQPMFTERDVAFVVDNRAPGRFWLDRDRMEQIFINLIDNALRYTPPGGEIRITAERLASGLRLSVRDTGEGIPPEDLPFVFERFYKGDKSRTRGKGGTGLGLAIVKRLVEAHGGTIAVESAVGRGTTFVIDLPLATVPPAPKEGDE